MRRIADRRAIAVRNPPENDVREVIERVDGVHQGGIVRKADNLLTGVLSQPGLKEDVRTAPPKARELRSLCTQPCFNEFLALRMSPDATTFDMSTINGAG